LIGPPMRGAPGPGLMSVSAITGGPGGGKSALLARLARDAAVRDATVVSEEAIRGMRCVRMSPRSREFQCALLAIQAGMEEGLKRALVGTAKQLIVTDRGTLDPCAFWQSFGNSRESFFEMTGTTSGTVIGVRCSVFGVGEEAKRVACPTALV